MRRRWTEKEIWDWYMSHEWISGFNLVPSTSLGGMLYVLQEYDHENAFRQTAKEGLRRVSAFQPISRCRRKGLQAA